VQFPFSLTGYTSFGIFQYLLWRHRITDRAIGFPLIQGAYMPSFRTADALLGGIATNDALYFVFCRHNFTIHMIALRSIGKQQEFLIFPQMQ